MKRLSFTGFMRIIVSITLLLTAAFAVGGSFSAVFCVPDCGEYVSAAKAVKGKYASQELSDGAIDGSFYDSAENISGLPKFDPRDELTPVKDQGSTNLCWAYSAINASEASILKHGIGTKDTLRLNPSALAYRKYVRGSDPLGNNAGYYGTGAGEWNSRAGQIAHAPAVLSMWQGPVSGDRPAADVWENSLYRLESANLISSGLTDDARIAEIKSAIAEYGAVTASCYYDGGTKQYYDDKEVSNGTPHAITLVGWDDDIDKDLFKPGRATRNGGWLVKNSYNDNGYFWLTYESKIASSTAWTFTYTPKDEYDYNYYYDNNENDFGLLKLKQFANVYEAKKGTAEKPEYIKAVNIGFAGNDVEVRIKVYTNLPGWGQTSVERGVLAAEKTMTFKYGGYNTVKLDAPVKLDAGSYFSIVAEVSDPRGESYVCVVQSDSKKPSFRKTSDGYDYISNGGCIARIKAYTVLTDAEPDHAAHNYGELIPRVEPTCSAKGKEAHYYCSGCGKFFDADKNETTEDALTIGIIPTAHDFDVWTDETPANCTTTGTKAHKTCKLCGKHYESDGITQIRDIIIAANDNHDFGAWTGNGDGTHTRVCKRESSHTETVRCSGGTATCTKKAVCDVCKTAYGGIVPHEFGAWADEIPPTTEKPGVKAHKDCTVCNKHFDGDGNEITDLTIAKIDTRKVTVVGGESGGFYKIGETATVKAAAPEEGTVFAGWQDSDGNIVSTDSEYAFVVTGEVSLTAVYEKKPSGDGSGSETGSETGGDNGGGSGGEAGGETGGETSPVPEKKGISAAAVAGIATGSVAATGIGGFAVFWFAVKKKTFAELIAAINGIFGKK